MPDFDRLTPAQIEANALREAQARLRKAIDRYANQQVGADSLEDNFAYVEAITDRVTWTYRLYVHDSCVCHMDYSSACSCQANWKAQEWLREVLGDQWHTLLSEAKVAAL